MRSLATLLLASFLAAPSLAIDVTGWVLDEAGAPIVSAAITAHPDETSDQRRARWMEGSAPEVLAKTESDAKGRFRLRADLPLVVRVAAPGREPFATIVTLDGEIGAIALRKAPTVRGSVKAAGAPLAGARVIYATWAGAEVIAITRADGSFEVPSPESWRVPSVHVVHSSVGVADVLGERGVAPLQISIDPPKSIAGTVVAPDGSPVPGAAISVSGWPLGTSDEEGRFAVRHALRFVRNVRAETGALVASGVETSPLRLALEPTHVLTGVVRDFRSNDPIPFAEVFAFDTARRSGVETRADARGRYRIAKLPAGRYGVSARGRPMSGEGGTPVTIPAEASLDVKAAAPAPPVRGRVVDEKGAPVAGARVAGGAGSFPRFDSARETRTAPDGSFILRNFQWRGGAAKSYLFAEAGGVLARSEPLPESLDGPVTIVIPPAAPLEVSVRDRGGAPIAGAAVATARLWEGEPYHGVLAHIAPDTPRTGEDGTVDLRLAPGVYDLRIEAGGFVAQTLTGRRAEPGARVDVVLQAAAPLRGRLVRPDGTPVAGTSVRASSESASGSAETGADGTFAILGLPPGEAKLWVEHHQSGASIERSVTLPEEDLVLELPMGGTIAGRVVDRATGAAITRFYVRTQWVAPTQTSAASAWIESADGTFARSGIAPGEIVLVVSADGYVPFWSEPLTLEEGKRMDGVEVKLERGATVRGRVTGPAGEPIEGAAVRIDTSGKYRTTTHFYELHVPTDANGEYVIPRVESGSKTITFTRQGYLQEKRTIDVSGAEVRADAQLARGGSLRGQVIDAARLPVAGARITARPVEGRGGWRSGESDASGAFLLEGLPRGLYDLEVRKEGYATSAPRRVDPWATTDLTIALEREAVIHGRVTGAPQSGNTTISVTAEVGGTKEHARADAGGNYRIRSLPGGEVTVQATVIERGDRTTTGRKRVRLPAGGEERVDFDLAGNAARGRVTVNGLPAAGAQVALWAAERNAAGRFRATGGGATVTTDASGWYETRVEAGLYVLQLRAGRNAAVFERECRIGTAACDVDLTGAPLEVAVIDGATRAPIAGASVRLTALEKIFTPSATHATGTDGFAGFEFVPAGAYTARVSAPGYPPLERRIDARPGTPQRVEITVSAETPQEGR